MEMVHSAENFQEDLLRRVRRIRRVSDHAVNQTVDRVMELSDKPGIRFFRPSLQFGHDRRFLGPDADCSRYITQSGSSRHELHAPTSIIGAFLPQPLVKIRFILPSRVHPKPLPCIHRPRVPLPGSSTKVTDSGYQLFVRKDLNHVAAPSESPAWQCRESQDVLGNRVRLRTANTQFPLRNCASKRSALLLTVAPRLR